jgi:uncharacterized Zn finger protein
MAEAKKCPKCSGAMTSGLLREKKQFGNNQYVWSPQNEPPFPMTGASNNRHEVVAHRCEACGFLEFYAPAIKP